MKTSGIKIEILPILGEATCKARDPFPSSSFPGDFPFLLPRFLSSSWLHFCSFLRDHQNTTDHPPAARPCSFCFSSPIKPKQQQQQQQKQLQEQRQNRGRQRQLKGDRRSCIFRPFSGHFRRLSLKLEACLTPIFSNSSQLLQIPLKSLNSNFCVLELK